MANQTNIVVNGTDSPISATLGATTVVLPARGLVTATGSDAEYTTLAATAGVAVLKSTTPLRDRLWIANALKSQD